MAAALWSAGGEQDLVLSVLSEGLAGERRLQRYDALRTIARTGTGAAGLLPALRGLRQSPEKSGGWVVGTLAVALWQAGRDPDESVPALLHAWSEHWDNRPGTAEAWARTVSAAAPPSRCSARSSLPPGTTTTRAAGAGTATAAPTTSGCCGTAGR
ncbi:hypothetical protein ACFYXP_00510 [Streptomyces sp. NPDC002466]|uniref:hypothetical protein n=1 Tax=Streptomyces sp. NPDC002466 TaxID=3364646 RepID=UPI0036845455